MNANEIMIILGDLGISWLHSSPGLGAWYRCLDGSLIVSLNNQDYAIDNNIANEDALIKRVIEIFEQEAERCESHLKTWSERSSAMKRRVSVAKSMYIDRECLRLIIQNCRDLGIREISFDQESQTVSYNGIRTSFMRNVSDNKTIKLRDVELIANEYGVRVV